MCVVCISCIGQGRTHQLVCLISIVVCILCVQSRPCNIADWNNRAAKRDAASSMCRVSTAIVVDACRGSPAGCVVCPLTSTQDQPCVARLALCPLVLRSSCTTCKADTSFTVCPGPRATRQSTSALSTAVAATHHTLHHHTPPPRHTRWHLSNVHSCCSVSVSARRACVAAMMMMGMPLMTASMTSLMMGMKMTGGGRCGPSQVSEQGIGGCSDVQCCARAFI